MHEIQFSGNSNVSSSIKLRFLLAKPHTLVLGRWLITNLVLFNAGWMVCDGMRALLVGDYLTPKNGAHAGQLGPWASVVQAAGIAPRATAMKLTFVVYGLAYLAVLAAFLLQAS